MSTHRVLSRGATRSALTPWLAIALFILVQLFFKLAFAMRTYFQKIADPEDIASTAAVAFTINHIAAVAVPFVFGLVWLISPALVFFAGAGMAVGSLVLSMLIPRMPAVGNETRLRAWAGSKDNKNPAA